MIHVRFNHGLSPELSDKFSDMSVSSAGRILPLKPAGNPWKGEMKINFRECPLWQYKKKCYEIKRVIHYNTLYYNSSACDIGSSRLPDV